MARDSFTDKVTFEQSPSTRGAGAGVMGLPAGSGRDTVGGGGTISTKARDGMCVGCLRDSREAGAAGAGRERGRGAQAGREKGRRGMEKTAQSLALK